MSPTLVHRYAFPIRDAIEALLGDAVGDCETWRIRIEGEDVVVDVVAPAMPAPTHMRETMQPPSLSPTADELVRGKSREDPHKHGPDAEPDFLADEQSGETSPEPALKGGPLARRAAIACGERGFWTFLGVTSAEEAKADICRRCGIDSRKMLDHDERAAAAWAKIDDTYRLWLEGYDVELA